MTTLCESPVFENGKPSVQGTVYKCFTDQGNGLLFRIVDEEKKQWAFYNDTKDFVMHVKVNFSNEAKIRPLGRSTVVKDREKNDGSLIAQVSIEPSTTELFVTGDTKQGFDLTFSAEAAPVTNPQYLNGRPKLVRGKVYKCFKNEGNGLLFRIVNDERKQWAFYNDTTQYVMKVRVTLSSDSKIMPLGKTRSTDNGDNYIYELDVEPLKTELFLQGAPVDYQLAFSADPIESKDCLKMEDVEFLNSQPTFDGEQVHKCFKNDGNGLLFLLMSGKKRLWAFYNDTTDFEMKAKVTFGKGSDIHPLGNTTKHPANDDGEVVCELTIPPLKTELFIEGDVTTYTSSFSAEPIHTAVPDNESVTFLNGKPTVEGDIYKVFKDNGNGLLFRIVNEEKKQWAFYNDTTDYIMKVVVTFEEGSKMRGLGRTTTKRNDNGSVEYSASIAPMKTELFAQGDHNGFALRCATERVAAANAAATGAKANGTNRA